MPLVLAVAFALTTAGLGAQVWYQGRVIADQQSALRWLYRQWVECGGRGRIPLTNYAQR